MYCPKCGLALTQDPFRPEGTLICDSGHLVTPELLEINVAVLDIPNDLKAFRAMIGRARISSMCITDLDRPDRTVVTVENLWLDDEVRVDVEFLFTVKDGVLEGARVRRG